MKLTYDAPNDLLYIAFEEGQSPVRNWIKMLRWILPSR